MPLSPALQAILAPHIASPQGTEAAILGACWPNDSTLVTHLDLPLQAGETIDDAVLRLNSVWSPAWLEEAGYEPKDAAGNSLRGVATATATGPITWYPTPRPCRVEDNVPDTAAGAPLRRRLSSEVALLGLWSAAATAEGIDWNVRPVNLSGGARGSRFKDLLVFFLQSSLPEGWRVEPEVLLTTIRGLHMRKTVGGRRSDIVVMDNGNRLVAVVSSKWTWRSDRGTEAAQMVPLMRYRPDVPYALVTAEFPRAATVGRESIEDRAYHVSPMWAGAWMAINRLATGSPRTTWPTLASLRDEGARVAETVGLPSLHDLVHDLIHSGDIL